MDDLQRRIRIASERYGLRGLALKAVAELLDRGNVALINFFKQLLGKLIQRLKPCDLAAL